MEPTTYGPYLIGGNSSLLGDCDISFTKKLKLLKAIRDIEADYIILDLGGQTSYNLLDFFLAADTKIVMADCNPDSLTQAYCFIKAALYRKLALLHGPQSMTPGNTDPILKKIFYETMISHDDPMIGDIETLLKRIKNEHPGSLKTIQKALLSFSPRLIINRSSSEKEAKEPAMRIRQVSREKLSIHVEYLCSLPLENSIKKNARVPTAFVSHDTNNKLAQKLTKITSTLMAAGHRGN